jgi:preprotein translocase subunit SecE
MNHYSGFETGIVLIWIVVTACVLAAVIWYGADWLLRWWLRGRKS